MAAKTQRRDRAGVDDEQILEPPRIRHVLVTTEDEVDLRALQALDRVTGVVDDVPFASCARYGQEVVVHDEDAQLGRGLELLLDPPIAPAPDLSMVEVGLGRVDADDRHVVLAQHRVTVAEQLLEVDVADIPRVMVARDDHDRLALDLVEVLARRLVLLAEAERGQVAAADDDLRAQLVDLVDRALEQSLGSWSRFSGPPVVVQSKRPKEEPCSTCS